MPPPDASRRDAVPFDPRHFESLAARGEQLTPQETFEAVHRARHWGREAPVSGAGADREQTRVLEARLPRLLADLDARSLLDLPCGDFGWMRHVDLSGIDYVGADLIRELVDEHQRRLAGPRRRFLRLDVLRDPLPRVDLVLCRDLLVHFAFADIARAVAAFRESGSTYLLTTTFPETDVNEDIVTGDWRPINLERSPFDWPPPLAVLVEGCTEGDGRFADKSLGLWRVETLPASGDEISGA